MKSCDDKLLDWIQDTRRLVLESQGVVVPGLRALESFLVEHSNDRTRSKSSTVQNLRQRSCPPEMPKINPSSTVVHSRVLYVCKSPICCWGVEGAAARTIRLILPVVYKSITDSGHDSGPEPGLKNRDFSPRPTTALDFGGDFGGENLD